MLASGKHWEGEGAEPFHSYNIITGPAAESVSTIHPRMPLVLPEAAWQDWLSPETPTQTVPETMSPT